MRSYAHVCTRVCTHVCTHTCERMREAAFWPEDQSFVKISRGATITMCQDNSYVITTRLSLMRSGYVIVRAALSRAHVFLCACARVCRHLCRHMLDACADICADNVCRPVHRCIYTGSDICMSMYVCARVSARP